MNRGAQLLMQPLLLLAMLPASLWLSGGVEANDTGTVTSPSARISEALRNLQRVKSLRFSSQETLRHKDRVIARVETSGEWLVGEALRTAESVWMGERTVVTNVIVVDGDCYVQSEGDEKWTVTKANAEDQAPDVIVDLPLYLKAAHDYAPAKDAIVKDAPCRTFEYSPVLPPALKIKAAKSIARVLISRKRQTITEVSLEATGWDDANDPVSFSYTASFYDFNAPLKIQSPAKGNG